MLVKILQTFDFGSRRYFAGDNPDVAPDVAAKWVVEGKAKFDTDGYANNPSIPGARIVGSSAELLDALAEFNDDASPGGWIEFKPGAWIAPSDPFVYNQAKCGVHLRGGTLDLRAFANTRAVTIKYSPQDTAAGNRGRHYMYEFAYGRVLGPGKDSTGSAGFFANGTIGDGVTLVGGVPLPVGLNMSVRPVMHHLLLEAFAKGFEGQDAFYLSHMQNMMFYNNGIGFSQNAGTDSGETVTISKSAFANNYLAIYMADQGSELKVDSTSVSYNRQCVCIDGNNIRVYLMNVHDEFRGANLAADNGNYALDGTTTDPRAPVAGKDSYYYVGGTNCYLRKTGGVIDANNSGGNGPYGWDNLCRVVDISSSADFIGVTPSNLANTNDKFGTGNGRIHFNETHIKPSELLPSRISDSANSNVLLDGGFEQAQIVDNIFICRDTAEIVDRLTGANISLSLSTAQKRNGSQSLLMTKAATGAGNWGILLPIRRRERGIFSGYFYVDPTPGTTGNMFISRYWVKYDRDEIAEPPVNTYTVGGTYKVVFIAATVFLVYDPAGNYLGRGLTGTAFSGGGLGFTITAGGTPFAAGDGFTISVTAGLVATPAAVGGNTGNGTCSAVTTTASDGGASRFKRSIPTFAAPDLSSASSWDSGIGKSALIASSGTINTATSQGTWRQLKVGHYDNAASGAPTCPDWATHEWVEFNTTSVVPTTGSALVYFDDLYGGRM